MTETLQERVAAAVRAELGRQRKSQTDLARLLGRSGAYTTRRIRGSVSFKLDELERIAHVLNVPLDVFMPRGGRL